MPLSFLFSFERIRIYFYIQFLRKLNCIYSLHIGSSDFDAFTSGLYQRETLGVHALPGKIIASFLNS